MCLPKNFAEEKEVKIYSQLGIHLCVLLMNIYFPHFHFKVATILLNITSKDCLYFLINCFFFCPWSFVWEQ